MNPFGKMAFSRSLLTSLRRGRPSCGSTRLFFVRRAGRWRLASGMRLASHVKAQCGEARMFDWCCGILSEAGATSGSRFLSKRALRCRLLRSKLHGHGRHFSSVITDYCPWCRSTFSSTQIARNHAAASMLSGHCRVDAGAFPWPISLPKSLQCRLCDDGDTDTSIDDLYDLSVAVHLPKPSPVSLPTATASHHASGARRNGMLPWEKR